jgi:hypothetical protein
MNTNQKNVCFYRLAGLIAVCLAYSQSALADLTPPTQPAGGVAICNHGTPGWTGATPPQWLSVSQLAGSNYNTTVRDAVASQGFAGTWSFQFSTLASGSIEVTTYMPRDGTVACEHGLEINITSSGVTLPPGEELQWLQLCDYSISPNSPVPAGFPGLSGTRIVDPPIGYYPGWDDAPFYYDVHGGTHPIEADGHFWDSPYERISDSNVPHWGEWDFSTLLVSWDGTFDATGVNEVTIYGMEKWGYNYQCIPEPATNLLLLFGLACVGCWRMVKPRQGR